MHAERLLRVLAGLATALPLLMPAALRAAPSEATLAACSACHGPQGNSQNPQLPSLAGQPKIFIENQLVLIREGLREIPAMQALMSGIKDDEIIELAKHFSARPLAANPTPVDNAKAERGAAIASRTRCGTCHLADFSGQQQVPRLAGQQEQYLLLSMQQFRDNPGPGRDTIMSATLLGLQDSELADLAHYMATFKR